jgi:peptidyl-prolyl cis-trans isomerase D
MMEAERLGYQVTDQDVADTIRQMIPNLFPDGKFVGKDVYAGMLAQQNLTIEQFENDLKRQILLTRMRNIAMEGIIVTPAEIEAAYRKKGEKIKIEWVKLTAEKYKAESQPSANDVMEYFKANGSRYMTPEKKNLTVLIADQAKLEASLNPTDIDLQAIYAKNQDTYRTPERVKVRHILVMTKDKPPADEPMLKTKADDVLKQVRAGGDFAKLAKEYSEDPGSKDKGGEYWVQKDSGMVQQFKDAAFRLKPGESDLVKTDYGYHVFQVMEKQAAGLHSFSEVKGEMADQWKKQRANELVQRAGDQAGAALKKDPGHAEKVAADFNMQVVKVDGYTGGEVPGFGVSPDFSTAVAGTRKGEVSQAVTADNKIAVAYVNDATAPHASAYEDVQSQIRDSIAQTRSSAAVQTHARELMDKASAAGGDFAKVAKGMGLEVKTSAEFDRSGAIDGLGAATYVTTAFDKPVGAVFGPTGTPDGGTLVGKVVARAAPDLSQLPAQRAAVRDDIKTQRARDRNILFEVGVKDMLIKQGKIKIHQDVINRLISSYRTTG